MPERRDGALADPRFWAAALLAVALLLAPAAAAHHTASAATYVGGSRVPGFNPGFAVCQSPPNPLPLPVGVGGACEVTCPGTGPTCTITVQDAWHGAWGFFWRCSQTAGVGGGGVGSAVVPNTCANRHYDVYVDVGATTGTITLS